MLEISPSYLNQIEHVGPDRGRACYHQSVQRGGRTEQFLPPRTTPGWLPNSVTLDRNLDIAITTACRVANGRAHPGGLRGGQPTQLHGSPPRSWPPRPRRFAPFEWPRGHDHTAKEVRVLLPTPELSTCWLRGRKTSRPRCGCTTATAARLTAGSPGAGASGASASRRDTVLHRYDRDQRMEISSHLSGPAGVRMCRGLTISFGDLIDIWSPTAGFTSASRGHWPSGPG